MKRCTKCDLKKELQDFYKSNSTEDGYHNSCKECWKKRRSERYLENRDKVRRQCRAYYVIHSEKIKENAKKHKKTYEQTRRWRDKNPEKCRAHNKVSNCLREELIAKPSNCEICNSKEKLQAHHRDYSRPLEILWVCKNCHAKIHIKEI